MHCVCGVTPAVLAAAMFGAGCAATPPPGDYSHIRIVHPGASANLDGCRRLEGFEIVASATVGVPASANARPKAQARAAEHPEADTVAFVDSVREPNEMLVVPTYRYTLFSYRCFD